MKTVGAYQAKTHLPALLDEVAQGEKIMITRHGAPVAILSPVPPASGVSDPKAVVEGLRRIREGMTQTDVSIIETPPSVKEMIEEGRRF